MAVKERSLPLEEYFPPVYWMDGSTAHPGGTTSLATGKQKTVSEGHPYNRLKGHWEGGGPFFTSRLEYGVDLHHLPATTWSETGAQKTYSGPVYCPLPSATKQGEMGQKPELDKEDLSSLDAFGATAVARCDPGKPVSNLGQAIAETAKDGFPSFHGASTWKDRTLAAKNAGSEYLNHQFGWVPLVSDVQNSARVAGNSGELAEQSASRAGQDVRRGYEFPPEESSSSIQPYDTTATFPGKSGSGWNDFTAGVAKGTIVRTTTIKRWFSGAFTYALPSSSDFWRKHVEAGRKARELYGLQLNPELLWEVAPWSWAVDWFSNTGDVISNVTRFSDAGQVMRYGYIMEERISKITCTIERCCLKTVDYKKVGNLNAGSGPLTTWVERRTKSRAQANPFGFGVSWEGLSPFQISIAAALGISRLR